MNKTSKKLNTWASNLNTHLGNTTAYFRASPEKFFLLVAAIFGLFLVTFLPPYRGLDEASHVYRIVQLSEGDILMEKFHDGYGHTIPDYIHKVNMDEFTQGKKSDFTASVERRYRQGEFIAQQNTYSPQLFEGSGSYSPLVYVHYLPAGMLANLMELNSYIFTLILRLSNLLLFIACAYMAIKIIPIGKWFLAVVCLLPMSIHQAATVSADGILISSLLIFIALIVRLATEKPTRHNLAYKRELISLFCLGILIGGSKPGYLLLVLAIFALPVAIFKSLGFKLTYISALFISCLMLLGVWSALLSHANLSGAVETFRARANGGGTTISTHNLVVGSATNPMIPINMFKNTFLYEVDSNLPNPKPIEYNAVPDFILSNFAGMFGSINIPLPDWASFLVIFNIMIAFLGFSHRKSINKNSMLWIGLMISIQFFAIFVVFWKTWTSTDMQHVWGLQGRYYIPLLPLLVFLLPRRSAFTWNENNTIHLLMTLTLIPLFVMALLVLQTFYGSF